MGKCRRWRRRTTPKGPADHSETASSEPLKHVDVNPAEQGEYKTKQHEQELLQGTPLEIARPSSTTETTMLIEVRTDHNIKGSEQSSG